jgi:hypothetical protein
MSLVGAIPTSAGGAASLSRDDDPCGFRGR